MNKNISTIVFFGAVAILVLTKILPSQSAKKGVAGFNFVITKNGETYVKPYFPNFEKDSFGPLYCPSSAATRRVLKNDDRVFAPSLIDCFQDAGLVYYLATLFNGGFDLASSCDIECHFKILGVDISEEAILEIFKSPIPKTGPLRDRYYLDRLLAIRLCSQIGFKRSFKFLNKIALSSSEDFFSKLAAKQAISVLFKNRERPSPSVRRLDDLLQGVSTKSAEIILIVNCFQSKPLATSMHKVKWLLNSIYQETLSGKQQSPNFKHDFRKNLNTFKNIQWGELNYEIARLYGNARLDRVLYLASTSNPLGGFLMSCQGRFEIPKIRSSFEKGFFKLDGKMLTRSSQDGIKLKISPERIILHSKYFLDSLKRKRGGVITHCDLLNLGYAENDIVFLHLRNTVNLENALCKIIGEIPFDLPKCSMTARLQAERLYVRFHFFKSGQANVFFNKLSGFFSREELLQYFGAKAVNFKGKSFLCSIADSAKVEIEQNDVHFNFDFPAHGFDQFLSEMAVFLFR